MTAPHHSASIDAELTLRVLLGSQITVHRPSARAESGPSWRPLSDDTTVGIDTDQPCTLRLRLLAYDPAGNLLPAPAWSVAAATREPTTGWKALLDRSSDEAVFLTDGYAIESTSRLFRFAVHLEGSGMSTTFELDVTRAGANADAVGEHDVLFDPEDDLKPPPTPTPAAASASDSMISAI